MKKMIALVLAIALCASFCISVSAAEISSVEQEILDVLKAATAKDKHGATLVIPTEYLNAAENYMLTADIKEEDKKQIIADINNAIAVVQSHADEMYSESDGELHLDKLPQSAKQEILDAGKTACADAGLVLTYTPATNAVTIVNTESKTVFNDTATVVKLTGNTLQASHIAVAVTVAIAAAVGVMYVAAKKNGLFAR